jgi:hypothetical protein
VGPDHDSPQPRATTLGQQQRLIPPHGWVRGRHVSREGDILQGINSESGPHGKVPDPWIYSLDLQVWSRTPTCTDRTPRMGSGPPPPRMGAGPPPVGSQGSRTEHTRPLIRAQAGVQCRHVSRPALVGSGPIRIHSCSPLRWRPDAATGHTVRGISQWGGTWHDASRLRASSHSLWIRRAPIHSTDRWRTQSTLHGPRCYSPLLAHF